MFRSINTCLLVRADTLGRRAHGCEDRGSNSPETSRHSFMSQKTTLVDVLFIDAY